MSDSQFTGIGVTYAKYIGRVGALAVARGIGATVAGVGGTAWADDTTSSPNSDTSDTSNETEDNPGNDPETETTEVDAPETETPDDSDESPDVEPDDTEDPTPEHRRPIRTLSELFERLRDSVVLDGPSSDEDDETSADHPEIVTNEPSHDDSTTAAAADAQAPDDTEDHSTTDDTPEPLATETQSLRVASAPQSFTAPPEPAEQRIAPPHPIRQVVGTILSAFGLNDLANTGTPRPLSVQFFLGALELIRREIQRTFFNTTPEVDATPNHLTVDQGESQTFTMPGTDADGDRLTYTVTQAPAQGTVSAPVYDASTDTYTFTYTADPDAPTVAAIDDSFTVTATDAGAGFHLHGLLGLFGHNRHSDAATVTVDIENSNAAPELELVDEPTVDPTTGAVTYKVRVTDPDGDPYTVHVPAAGDEGYPEHGELTVTTDGDVTTVVYTPDREYYITHINGGSESFVVAAEDAKGLVGIHMLTYTWESDQTVVGEVRVQGAGETLPVAFSEDRSVAYLVTEQGDGESKHVAVTVIDMSDYSVIGTYEIAPGELQGTGQPAVKGTTLYQVVQDVDGTNRLYSIGPDGQQVAPPTELLGIVEYTPQLSPDGEHLFVVSHGVGDDRTTTYFHAINLTTRQVRAIELRDTYTAQSESPYALTFTPDGESAYLVSNTADGQRELTIFDTSNGNIVARDLNLGDATTHDTVWYFTDTKAVGFAPMSSNGNSTQARVVDLATNSVLGPYRIGMGGHADTVLFSPDGSRGYVVAGDVNHPNTYIHVFDVNTGQGMSVRTFNNTGTSPQGTLSEDGQTLIIAVDAPGDPTQNSLILLNTSTGSYTITPDYTPGKPTAPLVYAEDGAAAYARNVTNSGTANAATHLTKYDTTTYEAVWTTETPGDPQQVYFADNGSVGYLVTTGTDADGAEFTRISAFDPQTGEITGTSGAFDSDATFTFSDDGSTVYLTTIEDGEAVFRAIDLGATVTNGV